MGHGVSILSLESLTAEQIDTFVGNIPGSYRTYKGLFISNNVDGSVLSAWQSLGKKVVMANLLNIGINNVHHQTVISSQFENLVKAVTVASLEDVREKAAAAGVILIDFEDFKEFGEYPRYPDHKHITKNIDTIDRSDAFIVFISHGWMQHLNDPYEPDKVFNPDSYVSVGDLPEITESQVENFNMQNNISGNQFDIDDEDSDFNRYLEDNSDIILGTNLEEDNDIILATGLEETSFSSNVNMFHEVIINGLPNYNELGYVKFSNIVKNGDGGPSYAGYCGNNIINTTAQTCPTTPIFQMGDDVERPEGYVESRAEKKRKEYLKDFTRQAIAAQYLLCIEGIEQSKNLYAPNMKKCYIWLDYSCLNQNENPATSFDRFDKIIEVVDCLFTPIVDTGADWEFSGPLSCNGTSEQENEDNKKNILSTELINPTNNHNPSEELFIDLFDEYKSPSWQGLPGSYLNRAWTRLEMFYASNIPLMKDKTNILNPTIPMKPETESCVYSKNTNRINHFKGQVYVHMKAGRRSHIIYGTHESRRSLAPKVLPLLENTSFARFNPMAGNLSNSADLPIIEKLVTQLQPYMFKDTVGYMGARNSKGQKHGMGTYKFNNGDLYSGEFKNDKQDGQGIFTYSDGNVYEGGWKNGQPHGTGRYHRADGDIRLGGGMFKGFECDVYEGGYVDNKMSGIGIYKYVNGDLYKGNFSNNLRQGRGILMMCCGDNYTGDWYADLYHGIGTYTYANGDVYKGNYKNGKKDGQGVFKRHDGYVYEGEFRKNKAYGQGFYVLPNGSIYDGGWDEDSYSANGTGRQRYPNGDTYNGNWKMGKRDGIGIYRVLFTVNGQSSFVSSYEGSWINDEKSGKGIYRYADGSIYDGEYLNDQYHGFGIKRYSDGSVYEGNFKFGLRDGKGNLKSICGNIYDGCWKNDKEHFQGTKKYLNGDIYEGEWANGSREGKGSIYLFTGDEYTGLWVNDKPR